MKVSGTQAQQILIVIIPHVLWSVHLGLPGDLMVKISPCNAGDMDLIPGQRTKIPHAVGQLSLCAATTEPTCHNLRIHTPQWKIPHDATKMPCTMQPNKLTNK